MDEELLGSLKRKDHPVNMVSDAVKVTDLSRSLSSSYGLESCT